MGVIKGVLKEELENSRSMLRRYREEMEKFKGSLVKKKIGRRYYYYIAKREGKKVNFIYQGPATLEIKGLYIKKQKSLSKYRKLSEKINDQIKFLKRALRGKESV